MPAEKLEFRVRAPGPLNAFTREHPEAAIALWCDWRREVIEVRGATTDAVEALATTLADGGHPLQRYTLGEDTHVLVMDCSNLPHDAVNQAIDHADCLNLAPTRFHAGYERYSVVSFGEERTRELFRRVREAGREVELIAKRKLGVQALVNLREAGVASLFDGLTLRQVEALHLAQQHGYYRTPRDATASQIAEAAGVSRSTFDEHLRKAEAKLVTNLVPYLELFLQAQRAELPGAAPRAAEATSPA